MSTLTPHGRWLYFAIRAADVAACLSLGYRGDGRAALRAFATARELQHES